MSVLSHLKDALSSLKKARDDAEMGTSLMIDPLITELEQLIRRTRNIDNDDQD